MCSQGQGCHVSIGKSCACTVALIWDRQDLHSAIDSQAAGQRTVLQELLQDIEKLRAGTGRVLSLTADLANLASMLGPSHYEICKYCQSTSKVHA